MDEEARQGFLGAPLATWTRTASVAATPIRIALPAMHPARSRESASAPTLEEAAPKVTADIDHLQAGALRTVACPDRKSGGWLSLVVGPQRGVVDEGE